MELGTLLNTQEWNRLRWQCRRGLLELDLVLERFLEKYGGRLQGERLVPHPEVEALPSAERETYRICLGGIQFKLSKQ